MSVATSRRTSDPGTRRWMRGGVLLGLGLGGFFDGIVLHQILQWHHLLSARELPVTLDALKLNTLFDGLFHALTYVLTVAGVLLVWQGRGESGQPRPWPVFAGTLLLGWGLFNVVEGLINHQLLGLHHVRPGPHQLAYDLGFLAWGAVMIVLGRALMRPRPG
ncbi:DUF2243 domain-containing protein [Deinococcus hohokamensis]|uniref:DUF2243 domain-containing protein n=1 Tax=Deinococcus hohokamensis TaxID=309883 RepID=A0ABV9I8G4_9DEIO